MPMQKSKCKIAQCSKIKMILYENRAKQRSKDGTYTDSECIADDCSTTHVRAWIDIIERIGPESSRDIIAR